MNLEMENIVKRIEVEYAAAKKQEYIAKPMAYALYQVWKYADRHEKERGDSLLNTRH